MGNLIYDLKIDWDGNGHVDATNEAVNLVRYAVDRGRDTIIEPSGGGFTPQQIGMLYLTLDNSSGRYDPWNTESAIYGDIAPGKLIEFKANFMHPSIIVAGAGTSAINGVYVYSGEEGGKHSYLKGNISITWNVTFSVWVIYDFDTTSNRYYSSDDVATPDLCTTWTQNDGDLPVPTVTAQVWPIFTGYVSDIQLIGKNDQVTIVAEDGWGCLSDTDFFRMTDGASAYGYKDELRPILTASAYPWGYDILPETGSTDLPRHWWWDGSAKSAIEMITDGSLGRSWIEADGTFMYRGLSTTDNVVDTIIEDECLKNIFIPVPWKNFRSKIVLNGSNQWYYYWSDSFTIATLSNPIKIDAGQEVSIFLNYKYDTISPIYSPGITYSSTCTAFQNANGTGTNITANITVTPENQHTSIKLTFNNTGAVNGYVTACTVKGKILEYIDADWTFESTGVYRASSFILDSLWLSKTAIRHLTYDEDTSTTLDDIERINTVGTTLLNYLSVPKPYPVIQMQGRYSNQFSLDIEDAVQLTLDTLGIDDTYRIHKISHRSGMTCQDVTSTFKLYPIMTKST